MPALRADLLRVQRPARVLNAAQLRVLKFAADPPAPRTDSRIDFAAIKRTSEFVERAATRTLSNLVARSVWNLLANPLDLVALLDQDVGDITSMRLPEAAIKTLQQACKQSLFMGWTLGVQQARKETQRKQQFTKLRFSDLRDVAASYLEANGFRMAENLSDGVRAILQQELMRGVRVGEDPESVVAAIFDRLIARGMIDAPAVRAAVDNESVIAQMLELDDSDEAPSYLSTLVRTNTFEAMNEARFAEFTDPALGGYVQALEYSAILDDNTTDFCRYMDGRVYAADSEVWDTHRPPNHYNCRSLLIPITAISGWDGTESEPPDVDPATGFARCGCTAHKFEYNPGQPRAEDGKWTDGGGGGGSAVSEDDWQSWAYDSELFNDALRGELRPGAIDGNGKRITESDVAELKAAAERIQAEASSHAVVGVPSLWRGVSFESEADARDFYKRNKMIEADGLVSTTTDPEAALAYAHSNMDPGQSGRYPVMLRYESSDAKHVGIQTNPLGVPSNEVVMPKGAAYRVAGVETSGGVMTVRLYRRDKIPRGLTEKDARRPGSFARSAFEYNPGQPRDDDGKWTDGGGGSSGGGDVEVYHGTMGHFLKSIKDKGLVPASKGKRTFEDGRLYDNERKMSVYVTQDINRAWSWAAERQLRTQPGPTRKSSGIGKVPVVLHVRIPAAEWASRSRRDEVADAESNSPTGDHRFVGGRIEPEWIVGYYTHSRESKESSYHKFTSSAFVDLYVVAVVSDDSQQDQEERRQFDYNPNQPRAEDGKWTSGGGSSSTADDFKLAVSGALQKLPVKYDSITQPGVPREGGKDALLAQAAAAQPLFTEDLTKTAGVLDAEIVQGNDAIMARAQQLLDNPDIEVPIVMIADMKGGARFDEKAATDYDGDYSKMRDVVRGSVVVPRTSDVAATLEALHEQGYRLAGPPKDRMNAPGPDGYRDIKMNVITANGHIAELQVLTPSVFATKLITAHDIYAEIRPLTGLLERGGRQPTADEARHIADNNRRQRAAYDAAWERDR